ncbi:hypothetical protein QJS83_04870 [Bdellovibrio sp. 22V]|uniref:hypothetical protein n=1 Tax=Bdellovibrio TaxID=958 RepID=UPI002542EFFC|nr:hypothetical protein [Bdellovibrio sp. 22V]WII73204.1 hypothetical protein QJS83_04870 [Bdellovibrio sp. 22V]
MKMFALLAAFLFSFSAMAQESCISENQAREILLQNESSLMKQVRSHANVRPCRSNETPHQGCITKTHFVRAMLVAHWNEAKQVYLSASLYNWLCAAGADCWVHATVNCQGETNVTIIGD